MRNTNKKGFTIIELVIVIAVIAILAAVLIPTVSGIIAKANESKDTQLVRNLNTALAADVDGDKTMAGALAAAAKFGYDIEKINASATDNEILWDSVNNVFCYLNDGAIEYIPEFPGAKAASDADYWVIDDAVNATYSTYLVNYDGASVEAKHSIDTTACEGVNVEYKSAGTVDIFTNGGVLTVNAPSATVNHYGYAAEVYVNAVSGNTFNLYANVGYLEVAAGQHVVLKSGSKANAIFADTTSNVEVKNGQPESIVVTSGDKEAVKTGATLFAGGMGTKENPYLIANREHMENLKGNSANYSYYKVASSDVEIDFAMWIPGELHGSFDGNGAIFNLNTNLFNRVDIDSEGYVKNLTVNANINSTSAIAVFGSLRSDDNYSGTLTFENVNVTGSITGAGAAPYGSYVYVKDLIFKNCTSSAIVTTTSTGTGSAGFVIHTYKAENVYLINSLFEGILYHTNGRTGYWADMSVASAWYVDEASSPNNGLYTVNKVYKGNEVITETTVTVDGVSYTKYAILDEYKTASGYTCWYTYVQAVKMYQGVTVQTLTSSEMFSGNKLTLDKTDAATSCKVTLFISPNDKNDEGGYLGAYYTEEAIKIDDKWSSNEIVNFIVKINGNATNETGISADGKTFNVVNDFYGNTYGTAYVQFVEYNGDQIISITNITISNVNQ